MLFFLGLVIAIVQISGQQPVAVSSMLEILTDEVNRVSASYTDDVDAQIIIEAIIDAYATDSFATTFALSQAILLDNSGNDLLNNAEIISRAVGLAEEDQKLGLTLIMLNTINYIYQDTIDVYSLAPSTEFSIGSLPCPSEIFSDTIDKGVGGILGAIIDIGYANSVADFLIQRIDEGAFVMSYHFFGWAYEKVSDQNLDGFLSVCVAVTNSGIVHAEAIAYALVLAGIHSFYDTSILESFYAAATAFAHGADFIDAYALVAFQCECDIASEILSDVSYLWRGDKNVEQILDYVYDIDGCIYLIEHTPVECPDKGGAVCLEEAAGCCDIYMLPSASSSTCNVNAGTYDYLGECNDGSILIQSEGGSCACPF